MQHRLSSSALLLLSTLESAARDRPLISRNMFCCFTTEKHVIQLSQSLCLWRGSHVYATLLPEPARGFSNFVALFSLCSQKVANRNLGYLRMHNPSVKVLGLNYSHCPRHKKSNWDWDHSRPDFGIATPKAIPCVDRRSSVQAYPKFPYARLDASSRVSSHWK
ncbi:hypothetical protein AcV7_004399 [Taiwanofungus camphoratus]|nr:hypothetical protein AcV7_004399 [Antrodia cinnamomea]